MPPHLFGVGTFQKCHSPKIEPKNQLIFEGHSRFSDRIAQYLFLSADSDLTRVNPIVNHRSVHVYRSPRIFQYDQVEFHR